MLLLAAILLTAREDVNAVLKQHKASRESIFSIHAKGSYHYSKPQPNNPNAIPRLTGGEYWRSGGKVRIRDNAPDEIIDAVSASGMTRVLTTFQVDGKPNRRFGSVRNRGHTAFFDLWQWAGFTYFHGNLDSGPIDELLRDGGPRLQSVDLDGVPCQRVEATVGEDRWTVWFDPAVNHMVRKFLAVRSSGYRYETTVESFRRFPNGVYFPDRVRQTEVDAGEKEAEAVSKILTFDALSVNEGVPGDVFNLTCPSGTSVFNQIRGTTYEANADWQPTGQESPVPTSQSASPPIESSGQTPLDADDSPWWKTWPVLTAVLLICFLAVFTLMRRRTVR